MLFIFCVGVEAGPNFFSIFFRDGKNNLGEAIVRFFKKYAVFKGSAGAVA